MSTSLLKNVHSVEASDGEPHQNRIKAPAHPQRSRQTLTSIQVKFYFSFAVNCESRNSSFNTTLKSHKRNIFIQNNTYNIIANINLFIKVSFIGAISTL